MKPRRLHRLTMSSIFSFSYASGFGMTTGAAGLESASVSDAVDRNLAKVAREAKEAALDGRVAGKVNALQSILSFVAAVKKKKATAAWDRRDIFAADL